MRIKQAIQVGDNVTNIMKLPCIEKCVKRNDGHGLEWLEYVTTDGDIVESGEVVWCMYVEDLDVYDKILYVHTLQHALRLSEIDKEIVL